MRLAGEGAERRGWPRALRSGGSGAILALGSPTSLGSGVHPSDVVDVPEPVGVLQVEQGVQRPVQVVGQVRDLLLQAVSRVRGYSPRRLPDKSMVNSWWQAGHVTAACAWPSALTRP